MNRSRLVLGALVWALTLQFFVIEAIAVLAYPGYSRGEDPIGLLGAFVSDAASAMNTSLVVQGALIVGGLVLLRPVLLGRGAPAATVLLGLAAAGAVLAAVVPLHRSETWHEAGTSVFLLSGGLGLIALAYALRPRSELVGTLLALLGLVATGAAVFAVSGVTLLGVGGTERIAVYALPVGLTLAGLALWWLVTRPRAETGWPREPRVGRRELKAQQRAERIRRTRERDAALEAAAERNRRPGRGATPPTGPTVAPGPANDDDPEDPWATPRRREE